MNDASYKFRHLDQAQVRQSIINQLVQLEQQKINVATQIVVNEEKAKALLERGKADKDTALIRRAGSLENEIKAMRADELAIVNGIAAIEAQFADVIGSIDVAS